jgi:hypothetical protein
VPDLDDVADAFRDELLAQDRQASRTLIDSYAKAWAEIRLTIGRLAEQIAEQRATGEEVPVSWLFDQERLARIERQVALEVDQIASRAGVQITNDQRAAVEMAREHTVEVLDLGGFPPSATFTQLPTQAVESLVGFAGNGSPLTTLLNTLGPDAAHRVRTALIVGVTTGQSVREIAASTRAAFGGNMARALLISRTEVMRSYREASHVVRLQHEDLLDGWVRLAALSPTTCSACLALHGTIYPVRERLREHPAGRCVALPLPKGERFDGEKGPAWFGRQDQRTREIVLGKAGAAAYDAGAVSLDSFVGTARSAEWGPSVYALSLRKVVGREEARRWARAS